MEAVTGQLTIPRKRGNWKFEDLEKATEEVREGKEG